MAVLRFVNIFWRLLNFFYYLRLGKLCFWRTQVELFWLATFQINGLSSMKNVSHCEYLNQPLSFHELLDLSQNTCPAGNMKQKLELFLSEFVDILISLCRYNESSDWLKEALMALSQIVRAFKTWESFFFEKYHASDVAVYKLSFKTMYYMLYLGQVQSRFFTVDCTNAPTKRLGTRSWHQKRSKCRVYWQYTKPWIVLAWTEVHSKARKRIFWRQNIVVLSRWFR